MLDISPKIGRLFQVIVHPKQLPFFFWGGGGGGGKESLFAHVPVFFQKSGNQDNTGRMFLFAYQLVMERWTTSR